MNYKRILVYQDHLTKCVVFGPLAPKRVVELCLSSAYRHFHIVWRSRHLTIRQRVGIHSCGYQIADGCVTKAATCAR